MKTKKIMYSLIFGALIFPSIAFGQWTGGTSNGLSKAGDAGLPDGGILQIVTNIMNWLLVLVGVIGIIGFVISGILYLTAAGDSNQIDRAKTAMTWSIVGVIVALMGYVIIKAVNAMLGGDSSTF
ncbi:MAG TPA: hypothetical protein DDY52_05290 [Candidatus Moranbacteria bacterium]|nr:MAG: hypothetical protein UR51_C0023G0014 [Candidatus Moranbacteria bacterium GW2011_GWF1_34_10]HBI17526.1 hypothetical protein [Candidatus Moranbacteria bacterium]